MATEMEQEVNGQFPSNQRFVLISGVYRNITIPSYNYENHATFKKEGPGNVKTD